jgi:hypothetical protein
MQQTLAGRDTLKWFRNGAFNLAIAAADVYAAVAAAAAAHLQCRTDS